MKETIDNPRRRFSWSVDTVDAGNGVTVDFAPEILIDLSIEGRPCAVQIETTTYHAGKPVDAPRISLAQVADIDGVFLKPDEAMQLGATLINLAERVKYDEVDRPRMKRHAVTREMLDTTERLAPIRARINSDAVYNAIYNEIEYRCGDTFDGILGDVCLTSEYGIGRVLGEIIDNVVGSGALTLGAWAAMRHRDGKPDIGSSIMRRAFAVGNCAPMREAVRAVQHD